MASVCRQLAVLRVRLPGQKPTPSVVAPSSRRRVPIAVPLRKFGFERDDATAHAQDDLNPGEIHTQVLQAPNAAQLCQVCTGKGPPDQSAPHAAQYFVSGEARSSDGCPHGDDCSSSTLSSHHIVPLACGVTVAELLK